VREDTPATGAPGSFFTNLEEQSQLSTFLFRMIDLYRLSFGYFRPIRKIVKEQGRHAAQGGWLALAYARVSSENGAKEQQFSQL
jgi:hypothetical protein